MTTVASEPGSAGESPHASSTIQQSSNVSRRRRIGSLLWESRWTEWARGETEDRARYYARTRTPFAESLSQS